MNIPSNVYVSANTSGNQEPIVICSCGNSQTSGSLPHIRDLFKMSISIHVQHQRTG